MSHPPCCHASAPLPVESRPHETPRRKRRRLTEVILCEVDNKYAYPKDCEKCMRRTYA